MSYGPSILVPIQIDDSMLISSTVAEPAAGETAWVSAGTYAVNDLRIRTQTHRVYRCILAHDSITTAPELDPTHWKDSGATLRWAMFDGQSTSQTTDTETLTVVLTPGFFNAAGFYNLTGHQLDVSIKTETGGSVFYSQSIQLDGPYPDFYQLLFAPYRQITKLMLSDILPYAGAEITITISAGAAETVGIGMAPLGDLQQVIDPTTAEFGGTQRGAGVTPRTNSYFSTDEFENTKITRRPDANDMDFSIILPRSEAMNALSIVQSVLSTPVAVLATTAEGYEPLNTFGLVSAKLRYPEKDVCTMDFTVKGMI